MSRRAFWSTVVIALLALFGPVLDQDDAAIFNYLNNVVEPHAMVRPRDYAPLPQMLFAYSLKDLPFVVQAIAYRLPPFFVMLLLHRELRRLLERHGTEAESVMLSMSLMAALWWLAPAFWTNLNLTTTTAFLAASMHVVRIGAEGRDYSAGGFAGLTATAASTPLAVILLPPLAYQTWQARGRGNARRLAIISSVVALLYASSSAAVAGVLVTPNVASIPALFLAGFETDYALNNALVALAGGLLVVAALTMVWRGADASSRVAVLSLAFIGLASVAAVILTDRLREDGGGFSPGHTLAPLLCAAAVVAHAGVRLAPGRRRSITLAGTCGLILAVTAVTWRYDARGLLETAFMRYRFLMVAQQFRLECRDGDLMVFEEEDNSPIVLCRPQRLPTGTHLLTDFAPSVGRRDPLAPDDERPVIRVFEPLTVDSRW